MSVCDPEGVTVLCNSWVHTDREITANMQEKIIFKDRQYTCKIDIEKHRLSVVVAENNKCYIVRGCVSLALVYPTRRAHAPSYVVNYDVSDSIIFVHIIAQTSRFSDKTTMSI